jgi:hypothetical protein
VLQQQAQLQSSAYEGASRENHRATTPVLLSRG